MRQPGQGRARLHELASTLQLQAASSADAHPDALRLHLPTLRSCLSKHQDSLRRVIALHEQVRRDADVAIAASR